VRIQNEPVSDEELTVARSYVVGSQAMDRRTNARQAWHLAAAELAGVGYQYFDVDAQYLGVVRTVIVTPE